LGPREAVHVDCCIRVPRTRGAVSGGRRRRAKGPVRAARVGSVVGSCVVCGVRSTENARSGSGREGDREEPGECHCSYEELARELGKPSADAARMAVSRALVRLAREMARDA